MNKDDKGAYIQYLEKENAELRNRTKKQGVLFTNKTIFRSFQQIAAGFGDPLAVAANRDNTAQPIQLKMPHYFLVT